MSLVAEEDLDWLRREGGPDIRLHLILLVSFAILLSIKPDILYLGLAINRGPDSPDPEYNPADKSA
jgi:hypothetical protein